MQLISVFSLSLFLTLILELGFALCWGLRQKHDLIVVALVNILTNPVVVLLYHTVPHAKDVVLLLELGAILVESFCYRFCTVTLRKPFLFSLCANLFSYGTGCVINLLL